MRFFKGRESAGSADSIAAFWTWWAPARDRVAAGIADGSIRELVDEISHQVEHDRQATGVGARQGAPRRSTPSSLRPKETLRSGP